MLVKVDILSNIKLIIFSSLLFTSAIFSQNFTTNDYKYWSSIDELDFIDFKKKSILDTLKTGKILAVSNITLDYFLDETDIINVIPVFNKKESYLSNSNYVSSPEDKENLLKHEQLHFDILELYARKIRKILIKNFKKTKEMNMKSFLKILETQMFLYFEFDDKYDNDTNHSLNNEEQEKWNNKIQDELYKLNRYNQGNYIDILKSINKDMD